MHFYLIFVLKKKDLSVYDGEAKPSVDTMAEIAMDSFMHFV